LRRQRDFSRAIDSSLAEGVYALDTEGRLTYMNPTAERILGWKQEELLGERMHDVVHYQRPDGTPFPWQECAGLVGVLRSGTTYRTDDDVFTRRDGTMFPVAYSSAPIIEDGQVTGAVIALQDITERKRAEEEAGLYQLMVECATDCAIFRLDADGRVATWNAGAERVTGYKAEEIAGRHFSLFYPPGEVELGTPGRELEVAADEGRFDDEGWRLRKDGGRFWASVVITALRDEQGNLLGFSTVMRDLTERKYAEDRLRVLAEASRAFSEAVPDYESLLQVVARRVAEATGDACVIRLLSGDGRLRAVAAHHPDSELLADIRAVMQESEERGDTRVWKQAIEERRSVRVVLPPHQVPPEASPAQAEFVRRHPVAAIVVAPLVARDRVLGGMLLVRYGDGAYTAGDETFARDLADRAALAIDNAGLYREAREENEGRRRAEGELRGVNATLERRVRERTLGLEEANAALEAFASSVAHDLRAPLRGMQGLARALLEDYSAQLDAGGRDYASRIEGAGESLDRLIEDLLAYAHLSRAEVSPQPVDLGAAVGESLRWLGDELRGAEVSVGEGLGRVMAHPTILVQVLANLLSNAAKFVGPGTRPRVEMWAEERRERVRLWVADNGIGIAPEHRERIFGVFERLHGAEEYPGSGVGLGIVRRGVERMGGGVGVDSQPGEGSRFWIELPRAE
jgi:PAS domain S-box-containing protein